MASIPAAMRPRSPAGGPGVLHGNRTYLLQDDDGQIIEAHSISAGLDYPGIGPEHAWLHDLGRVKYVSCHGQGGAGGLPAAEPAGGHHSRLRARPCAGRGGEDRAQASEGPSDRGQSLRPRRQGHLRRRQASGYQAVSAANGQQRNSPSIARFAELKQAGRAGLVTFVTAGDPDPATSLASGRAPCPAPAPMSSSSACPSPIPWPTGRRSRPPRCARSRPGRR